jgi:DNA repair exonuclease SbcCD nuclease subunit
VATEIRILLIADSHLGFDLPLKPRVERRRRGHDFLRNYDRALEFALEEKVDLVVHGGDVFDRPRVPPSLAYQAFKPLVNIADRGIPVFIVAGNHERSMLPHIRFARHPLIHLFDRPQTFVKDIRCVRIALAGFPYERRNVRNRFPALLEQTALQQVLADVRLLCIHHCVEGATVGPGNFTFTTAADVIRCADLPVECAAVFSGHIHRRQALVRDLRRRPLQTPVLYPGSIERTSIAEAGEEKGFLIVTVSPNEKGGTAQWEYRPLPARPMVTRDLDPGAHNARTVESALVTLINSVPPDAVLRIRLPSELTEAHARVLTAANLRRLAPATMNVDLVMPRAGGMQSASV